MQEFYGGRAMKYSHNYSKLEQKEYTTIRRYSKGKVGRGLTETYPGGYHFAQIVKIERKPLIQVSTELLLKDTDCETREEAIELIQSFYKKPIDYFSEKFYIYHMERC